VVDKLQFGETEFVAASSSDVEGELTVDFFRFGERPVERGKSNFRGSVLVGAVVFLN
jgi:hypothetical protein